MKKIVLTLITTISLFSCSKNDDNTTGVQTNSDVVIKSRTIVVEGFNYKEFYQETANSSNRKGLIIMAHGDGGTENDATLNDQCAALAKEGYVAITTSYRPSVATWDGTGANFKTDIESVIADAGTRYRIARNKTILGGLSRGGLLTLALILPNGQFGPLPGFTGDRKSTRLNSSHDLASRMPSSA